MGVTLKINRKLNYDTLDNEAEDIKQDIEITKYHEKVISNKLTPEEKQARENLEKLCDMTMDEFFNGGLDQFND